MNSQIDNNFILSKTTARNDKENISEITWESEELISEGFSVKLLSSGFSS